MSLCVLSMTYVSTDHLVDYVFDSSNKPIYTLFFIVSFSLYLCVECIFVKWIQIK